MDTTYSPIGGKVSDKTEKKGMCEEADKTKQEYLNISTVQILYLLKFGSISIFSRKKKNENRYENPISILCRLAEVSLK